MKTILVVEDERIVAKDLQQTLIGFGYAVPATASTSDDAVRFATAHVPDLVVMDIRIKGTRDGIETAEILRRELDIPFVYLTAYADDETIERVKASVPYGYLVKPVKPFELRTTIELALHKHALEQRTRDSERDRTASLDTMAAGVAHEINNPLAVVVANAVLGVQELAELMRETTDPDLAARLEDLHAMMIDIRQSADRVAAIVAALRTFSRPRDEGPQLLDVRESLEWALRSVDHRLRANARVVRELAPVPTVIATRARLGQAFVNLLSHAIHAVADRPREGNEIRVCTRVQGERVIVEIADNGPALSPETRARIFEPFFAARTRDGESLGLAVCHGIVAAIDGTIAVDAPPGGGTVFTISLPVATELPAPIIASVAAPRRGKVIVIDDEPLLLGSIRRVLARDHDVEAFDDADRAFDAIIARPDLDVILCDLIMPKVSGMDLYERLLSATPDLAARVVFVTGGAFSQQGREFLAAVPNRVIEKPFGPDRLRSLVRELVAQRS